jgi:transcriptional regulator of arginine metabolism
LIRFVHFLAGGSSPATTRNTLAATLRPDQLGRPRYVLAQDGRRSDPREALASVLSQFGRRATAAQNIVVVHSELGSAPAIGRALDRLAHPLVVGTLAGDDTCLVIAADKTGAAMLARELGQIIG